MISIFTIYSDICKISAPAHWQIRRFKDIITSSRSGIWGDEEKGDANDIVCYRVADFDYSNLCLKFDNITYRNVLPEQANEKLLSKGDLLLEKSGGGEKMPVGRVVLVNSPLRAVCSNFIQALSVNKKQSARFVLYLFHSIYSNRINTLFFNQTTGIQNLKTAHYLAQEIFLPPYSEQEAIAAYLDKECEKIGRKIELLERKADAYSRLRRSLINRAVTRGLDPNVSLKPSGNNWIGDIPQHWGYERVEKYFHNNTSYNKDFQYKHAFKFFKGTIIHKDETFEEDEYQDTYEKYTIVEPNDIIINGLNLNYDLKSMRVGKVTENGIITSAYIVLRPYNNVCSDFFNYLFKAFDYRKFFHGMGKGIRLTLSFNELRYFEIPIPPIDEQKKIAAYLDEKCAKIDAILEKINTEVERLKELKRSLINEVVTGQRVIETESRS
jgi:type I restriction modification DNA specificity domain protein